VLGVPFPRVPAVPPGGPEARDLAYNSLRGKNPCDLGPTAVQSGREYWDFASEALFRVILLSQGQVNLLLSGEPSALLSIESLDGVANGSFGLRADRAASIDSQRYSSGS
jgi:hypothetical protein